LKARVNTAKLGRLEIAAILQPVKEDFTRWEVVFKLPFEYNAAIAYIASGASALKCNIDYRISTIAGDYKTRFEKIEAAIEDLDKQLTSLEEKHKRILKEEEDYDEDDW